MIIINTKIKKILKNIIILLPFFIVSCSTDLEQLQKKME